ncbi:MAG: cadherin domain-containing protein [Spirochaetales bacterium]|nr:cadherin domain-containing protein [Spirochaetales bacterium]
MSVVNKQSTLPQRALHVTVLMIALLWFPLTVLAGTSTLNDYNPYDVNIPDNGSSVDSDLSLSGAPSGAPITKVKVYYEIKHPRPSDLDVWLTCYDGGWQGDYFLHTQGSSASVDRITVDNIDKWNGKNPNVTWYLVARDRVSGSTGYIDFFELWVTYSVNDPPNEPDSEDPVDGKNGVSRTTDLDWSCSDPDGDTPYYICWLSKGNSTFSDSERIKIDATGSNADPGTLDYGAHYYWKVKADDHNGGVTWGPVWDFYTESEPVIDATITIQPIASVIQGETLSVNCDVQNDGNVIHSFGVGAEIKDGSIVTADLGERTASSVSPGSTKTVNFTYGIPEAWAAKDYTLHAVVWSGTSGSSDWLDDDNRTFTVIARDIDASITVGPIDSVQAWGSVTIPYDVTNDGNVNHAFGVGAEIWKDGVKQNDVGSQTTASVSPDNTTLGSFSHDIPSTWSGTYMARCAVWSGTPGSSTWLDSYERSFTVNPAPLSLNGRIAYHTYSKYMAVPGGGDTTDGQIFVYDCNADALRNVTASLPLVNAMNPHFSADGARLVFMAVPEGKAGDTEYDSTEGYWHRKRTNLDIYVLDLSDGSLVNLTPNSGVIDEDPKFSPNSSLVVWKREGQIWRMNADGTSPTQLTSTPDEKSGPNYSPDASKIVYWSDGGSSADIWWMSANGLGSAEIVGNASIQDYYPIYRDSGNILYSRWESTSDHHDKIYNYNIGSGSSSCLQVNVAGVEDADAAPVNSTYLVMSSTRNGGEGSYDIYVGRYDNAVAYSLTAANSVHKDLGPYYSQYTYARTVMLIPPSTGPDLHAGESILLTAQLWSDAAVWAGASLGVTFDGPTTVQYTGLKDDGTQGDVTPGDGIYSKTVTLPSTAGSYMVSASSQSVEPGVTRQVSSSSVTVNIEPANSTPTDISLSDANVQENQPSGTTIGTLSTTDPDIGNTFTYTLDSGAGSTNNGSFTIDVDQLKTAASFDYESKSSHSIRVRTTDQGGLWHEKIFIILVNDVDEILKGDLNADDSVDLADAILALRVSVGISGGDVYPDRDVNGDGRIGLEEVIYVLQKISGLRN